MARLRNSARLFRNPAYVRALAAAEGELEHGGVFALDLERLFGRKAPLEVEIGSGKGDFIVERARAVPEHNFLAIELAGPVYRWLAMRCLGAGLANLVAIRADARSVVNLMLPAGEVDAFHIYYPDPWPKTRHSKHRLFSPPFVAALARALRPGGVVYFATDVGWYFCASAQMLAGAGLAHGVGAGGPSTHFGRKWEAAGRPIHASSFVNAVAASQLPLARES